MCRALKGLKGKNVLPPDPLPAVIPFDGSFYESERSVALWPLRPEAGSVVLDEMRVIIHFYGIEKPDVKLAIQ